MQVKEYFFCIDISLILRQMSIQKKIDYNLLTGEYIKKKADEKGIISTTKGKLNHLTTSLFVLFWNIYLILYKHAIKDYGN
ncbi:MAG: hypothetical protein C4554_07365 [Dethiobacter sp.]|jgi:hypothetical protein|nr:MAG: hypothetical protein C4554_07365 [Dethiobacter sp.]